MILQDHPPHAPALGQPCQVECVDGTGHVVGIGVRMDVDDEVQRLRTGTD